MQIAVQIRAIYETDPADESATFDEFQDTVLGRLESAMHTLDPQFATVEVEQIPEENEVDLNVMRGLAGLAEKYDFNLAEILNSDESAEEKAAALVDAITGRDVAQNS